MRNTTDFNLTNLNFTVRESNIEATEISWIYTKGIGILITVCSISIIVNTRVLMSVHWIRRPLSATLYISLSLAAADLITSLITLIHYFLNSYLFKVWGIKLPNCIGLTIEAFRLGGIVNTVLHLLLLACNHYLGIVKPLHYPSIMTHRKTTVFLVMLWILPPVYMLIYFSMFTGQGFQNSKCSHEFMVKFKYRIMFIPLLVVPLILMTIIYTHILLLVRRQQRTWHRAAERGASCRHRGGVSIAAAGAGESHRRRQQQHMAEHRRNQQMARNVKALYTTLYILGSFVAGLLPPILVFLLVCNDCMYTMTSSQYLTEIFWFVNFLLVTKPLANPIIYAARMQEIKEATRRMRVSLCYRNGHCRVCSSFLPFLWLCCGWSAMDAADSAAASAPSPFGRHWPRTRSQGHTTDNSTSWPRTQLCRIVSNGNTAAGSKNGHASTVL